MVLFITGTNTGVGKTTFSYLLAKSLLKKGIKVGYWKPVETGADPAPSDASLMAKLLGQSLEDTVLYTFRLPLAPSVAEKYEGDKIDLKVLKEKLNQLKERYEFLIVEGAGGLAVPIKGTYTYADFAFENKLPTLIVSDAKLGTINCSYLTAFYGKEKKLNLVGFAFNNFTGEDFSEKDNPSVVEKMTSLPVLFKIPYSENWRNLELPNEGIEKLLKLPE